MKQLVSLMMQTSVMVCLFFGGCAVLQDRCSPKTPLAVNVNNDTPETTGMAGGLRVTIKNCGSTPVYVASDWADHLNGQPTFPFLYSAADNRCIVAWICPTPPLHGEIEGLPEELLLLRIDPGKSLVRHVRLANEFYENTFYLPAPRTPVEIEAASGEYVTRPVHKALVVVAYFDKSIIDTYISAMLSKGKPILSPEGRVTVRPAAMMPTVFGTTGQIAVERHLLSDDQAPLEMRLRDFQIFAWSMPFELNRALVIHARSGGNSLAR